jgi:hypothetical protein
MGWNVDPEGLRRDLRPGHSRRSRKHLGPAARRSSVAELELDDVDRFVCHPGGTKVVDAVERAALHQGSLDHERAVLAEYGNMSAPTVLFVLERVLRRAADGWRCCAGAGASPPAVFRCKARREPRRPAAGVRHPPALGELCWPAQHAPLLPAAPMRSGAGHYR